MNWTELQQWVPLSVDWCFQDSCFGKAGGSTGTTVVRNFGSSVFLFTGKKECRYSDTFPCCLKTTFILYLCKIFSKGTILSYYLYKHHILVPEIRNSRQAETDFSFHLKPIYSFLNTIKKHWRQAKHEQHNLGNLYKSRVFHFYWYQQISISPWIHKESVMCKWTLAVFLFFSEQTCGKKQGKSRELSVDL